MACFFCFRWRCPLALSSKDNELRIKRYTEKARTLIKIIPSDVGRPLEDLKSKLQYSGLESDATEVLATLATKELQVETTDSGWYLMRLMPYRTASNMIDGVVITFVDIDATILRVDR